MRKLNVFESCSVDGYFKAVDEDVQWTHRGGDDPEFGDWVSRNASGGGELLFGRVTYQMMEAFWPTPMAAQQMPVVAKRMNAMTKYVVSRSLREVGWENTRLLKGDLVGAIRKLKAGDGPPITILGSGSIVAQLSEARLIDQYQFVVVPVVLGAGKAAFAAMTGSLDLKLVSSRTFNNGKVVLTYACA